MDQNLVIITPTELIRIDLDSIVYFSSDHNYSYMHQVNGEVRQIYMQLGKIEDLLEKQYENGRKHFERVGRFHVVNLNYIYYINPARQRMILSDGRTFSYEIQVARDELVEQIKRQKELIEKEISDE